MDKWFLYTAIGGWLVSALLALKLTERAASARRQRRLRSSVTRLMCQYQRIAGDMDDRAAQLREELREDDAHSADISAAACRAVAQELLALLRREAP